MSYVDDRTLKRFPTKFLLEMQ